MGGVGFVIPYFQQPFVPSTVGSSDWSVFHWYVWQIGDFISTLTLENVDTQFYKLHIFHQTYLQNTVLLLFLSVFILLLGYVALFWHNLASSKPMSAISLCMGCCQVVCLSEHLWPRLGAWLSRLGVTINCFGGNENANEQLIYATCKSLCFIWLTCCT